MAAKVFESLGKLGLGLAVVGGVVNSALYNGECGRLRASSSLVPLVLVSVGATVCFHC